MKQIEIEKILCDEFSIYYSKTPSPKSLIKLHAVIKEMTNLEFTKQDIISYVEYCYRTTRSVKDINKRSSIDYFVAVCASISLWPKFLDYFDAKKAVDEETGEEESPPPNEDDSILWEGKPYVPIGTIGNIDIFFNSEKTKLIIRDNSLIIPKYERLVTWNKKHPKNKVGEEKLIELLERKGFNV